MRDWSLRQNSRNYVIKDVGEPIHAHNAEERMAADYGSRKLLAAMVSYAGNNPQWISSQHILRSVAR